MSDPIQLVDKQILLREKKNEKIDFFCKLVFTYILGGFIGTLWETALTFYTKGVFEFRNGSFYTPINPVYGFGLVAIILCLHKFKKSWEIFLIGMIVGGAVEYLLSYLEELILGTRSWDYSDLYLNINGRTTIPYAIFWGIACLLVIKILYPFFFRLLSKIKPKTLKWFSFIFLFLLIIDLSMTALVLFRYSNRTEGIESNIWIWKWIDRRFSNARVELFFPNLKKVK